MLQAPKPERRANNFLNLNPSSNPCRRRLQVPIRVLYLDRSMYSGGDAAAINHHDFIPDEPPAGTRWMLRHG